MSGEVVWDEKLAAISASGPPNMSRAMVMARIRTFKTQSKFPLRTIYTMRRDWAAGK